MSLVEQDTRVETFFILHNLHLPRLMTQFSEMLFKRHSIRRYTQQPIPADDVKTILQAALLAPTSKSSRSWQFIVVENREDLEALAKLKPLGAHPIAKATMAVVVVSDPEKSEAYIEDATVAATYMQLQAEDLGIGSCWIQVRGRFDANNEPSEDYVQHLLDIPPYLKVECVITFGYKDETRRPVDPDKLQWEKVHIGKYTKQ